MIICTIYGRLRELGIWARFPRTVITAMVDVSFEEPGRMKDATHLRGGVMIFDHHLVTRGCKSLLYTPLFEV